ncbi:MAG: HPr kinase/phosphatase C-terminal domain-containing protein [Magnetovibrio sp.]|nr:HPr kinase/phosphatase C-terminal domain-containing protein [Magnetovibrio sp.]
MKCIHATCVALDGSAVLLRGDSGSGKSDLALRLIDESWDLVSDDYTELEAQGHELLAQAPKTINGLFEVRGLGLIHLQTINRVPVQAVFDLKPLVDVERLPEFTTETFEGLEVPRYTLYGLEASAPAKIRMALKAQTYNLFFNLED